MKQERSPEGPESNVADAGQHVDVEIDWNVGAGGIGHRQRVPEIITALAAAFGD